MADDDGMILNLAFDTPKVSASSTGSSASTAPKKNNIKGGTWKDRRAARKAIQEQYDLEHGIVREEQPKGVNDTKLGERKPISAMGGSSTDAVKRKNKDIPAWKLHKMELDLKKRKKVAGERQEAVKKARIEYKEKPEGKDGNTFVSSIFTTAEKEENKAHTDDLENDDAVAQDPSNAPLKGDTNTFPGLGVGELLTTVLNDKLSMDRPTKIQRGVIPKLLSQDKDLFVQAQTGSGKTLAFSLPILERLCREPAGNIDRNAGLFAVIMAPTRELAQQIYSVLESLCRGCNWIVPGIVTGGEKKKSEKARIRKGINILVATPGRLADHIDNTESLDLSEVRWVVMDEGDRLMELGFEETITKILNTLQEKSKIGLSKKMYKGLPTRRVNVLCSATIKGDVKKLGEMSLKDADWVSADSMTDDAVDIDGYQAPAQLIQESIVVPAKLRLATLASTLRNIANNNPDAKIMVFFSCSDSVDFHFSVFTRGSATGAELAEDEEEESRIINNKTVLPSPWIGKDAVIHKLHGSLNQQSRTATLNAFSSKGKKQQSGQPSILFCTDVASRGLDLPAITNVIEYDAPFATDDHVHRVGRTARAGQEGQSVLFLLPGKEEGYLDLIRSYHPHGIKPVSYVSVMKKAFGKEAFETEATTWHLNVERWLLEDQGVALTRAKRAFTSHIRAYATHLASERAIFNLRDLHLGHIAKSFGLRETPGKVGGGGPSTIGGKGGKGEIKKPEGKSGKNKLLSRARSHASTGASEFNMM
ncbi:hypothetical protein DV451_000572 [Geotrichum candidum]|uniref:ATP-dependent RNA helicase n=1 Tax=Geotrichum candidum TaxID=1173061 RepID=A0A9P5KWE2_GEOCN|nr:hypothetical protein DV451_000572 [Geotrichum candidum]KAF5108820.1 hypothetical protein DV453_001989 [Geotrichum candidum]